ncbi:hypothetical protein [Bordetella sp. 2513F-2]
MTKLLFASLAASFLLSGCIVYDRDHHHHRHHDRDYSDRYDRDGRPHRW